MKKTSPSPLRCINLSSQNPSDAVLQGTETDQGIVNHLCCFVHPSAVAGIEECIESYDVPAGPGWVERKERRVTRILLTSGAVITTNHSAIDLNSAIFGV